MKLRTKFGLSVLALVGLVIAGVSTMTLYSERRLLKKEITKQQVGLVEQLARVCGESILQNELLLINYFKGLKSERGFHSAGWINLEGQVQLFSEPGQFGMKLDSPREKEVLSSPSLLIQSYETQAGEYRLDYAAPILVGGRRVGIARLLFDKSEIDTFIHTSLKETLKSQGLIGFLALLIGLIGALWLSRTLVKPVNTVIDGLQEVAEGRLEPFPETQRRDELGFLIQELNITIQKLKELDQMKREFTSSVTHELRSPLTAIEQLIAHSLKGTYGTISIELRDSLVTAKNYCTRLGQFVDDLLTTAKLESRRMDVFLEDFDIRKSIKDVHLLYTPLAKEKGLQFKMEIPPSPLLVKSDQGKSIQIITNLVSNAFKFTTQGSVKIQARDLQNKVEISVSDTGSGIPESELPHIFNKFYQSPHSAKKVKGTGLGLAIVKNFLDLLDGKMAVKNNPTGGVCFTFWLLKSDLA